MNRLKSILPIVTFSAVFLFASDVFAQQLQTLYDFLQPPNDPVGGVTLGPDGNFYGTTYEGGAFGYGSVFRLTTNSVLTDLVDFNAANGSYPSAGLVSDTNGNFYGTTEYGGGPGYGTVFRITTNGLFTTLLDFYPAIGANPAANLIWGNDGNLYGTTVNGGTNNDGTVFGMTTNGVLNPFFSFSGTDGSNPSASLYLAGDGNFYGTAEHDGPGFGIGAVFRLTPGGVLTDLGSFDYLNNGGFPTSSLVEDSAGNFYGTSTAGGGGGAGSGTLFEVPATNQQMIIGLVSFPSTTMTPESGMVAGPGGLFYGATLNTIYQFNPTNATLKTLFTFSQANGADAYATPVFDSSGNLYGTTAHGGTNGYGTVYKLQTNNTLISLYAFLASPGSQPLGGLAQESAGTIYGTTYNGGADDNGTIFSFTPNGALKVLLTFDSENGAYPCDGLLLYTNGLLYGTSKVGGGNGTGAGTIFDMGANGAPFNTLHVFDSDDGGEPVGGLISDSNGNFYGAGYAGGSNGYGTVFKLDTSLHITTLLTFNYTNGAWPNATPVLDSAGYLWGSTVGGGSTEAGTIFKVSTNGIPTNAVYVPFATFNSINGSIPESGLTPGPNGSYYGTALYGGAYSKGLVFQVTSNGLINPVASFPGGSGGAYPIAGLIPGTNHDFYGTTSGLGANTNNGYGSVFRVTTNGVLTTYVAFNGTNGSAPSAPLLLGQDGALYGTTQYGGALGSGTIFKLVLGPILPTELNIQTVSNLAVLSWTNPVFNLQYSSTVSGPWANEPGAFSPYTTTLFNKTKFFRLQAPSE